MWLFAWLKLLYTAADKPRATLMISKIKTIIRLDRRLGYTVTAPPPPPPRLFKVPIFGQKVGFSFHARTHIPPCSYMLWCYMYEITCINLKFYAVSAEWAGKTAPEILFTYVHVCLSNCTWHFRWSFLVSWKTLDPIITTLVLLWIKCTRASCRGENITVPQHLIPSLSQSHSRFMIKHYQYILSFTLTDINFTVRSGNPCSCPAPCPATVVHLFENENDETNLPISLFE